jgi:hypothetical protein
MSMGQYRIWLRDNAPQCVVIYADSELEAQQKAESMIEAEDFYDFFTPQFQQSEWSVTGVEPNN